jgi:hypothetical protein
MEKRTESGFYERDAGAPTLMTLANFPDDVLPLLMESLTTFAAMGYFGCDALIELGCYDGRGLEIARALNARYRGVDLNRQAIKTLQARIEREGMHDKADTVVDDIFNYMSRGQGLANARPLYLLPFNLLGNFRDQTQILKALASLSVGAVISVFRSNAEATRVRQAYYLRCGIRDLEIRSQEDGIVFTGADGFYSRSFTESYLLSLLTECGLTVVHTRESSLAHCATVQLAAAA